MSKYQLRFLYSALLPGTGIHYSHAFILLIALIAIMATVLPTSASAENIRVSASVSSSNVMVGERFTLNIEVRSREPRSVSRPDLPDLTGFRYLSTVPRTGTSYSQVNGVPQMSYRYSYTVEATDSGAWQIPTVYIDIDGREYRTEPVTVIISTPDEDSYQRPLATRPDHPAIFLELELSEVQPVRGQQIIAEIVLYFRNTIEINTFYNLRSWQTEGFWREDLNQSQIRRPESVILGGESYRRAVLARYALFPTRSGELTVPSYAIRASVRQSGRFRNEYSTFFDGFGRQRNVDLETSPLTLSVGSLPVPPSDGQLVSALGQYTIDRTLSDDRVVLGEAVEVITDISGSGNLGMINRPSYEYPDVFDTHQPQEIIDRDEQAPRMSGIKQFRDVLIPRSAGSFTIPENTILVYNDATRQYERHTLPELTLEVIRDPNARVTMALNNDIRLSPVRGSVTWHQEIPEPFYYTWWFWFALAVPAFLFTLGYRSYRYKLKLAGDEQFSRYERAYRQAVAALDAAAKMQEPKPVYSAVYKAVSSFITARLNLPVAGFTEEQLRNALRKRNVETPLSDRVYQLLNKCASIRYAPDPSPGDRAADLTEARKLLSELKRQL